MDKFWKLWQKCRSFSKLTFDLDNYSNLDYKIAKLIRILLNENFKYDEEQGFIFENKWCNDDTNLTRLSRLFINELLPKLENDQIEIANFFEKSIKFN